MTAVRVVFDIETISEPPSPEDIEAFEESWTPPSTWKNPEKILGKKKVDLEKYKQGRTFDAETTHRIISIAAGHIMLDEVNDIQGIISEDEKEICEWFIDLLNDCGTYQFVGFNILNFDLIHLARALRQNKLSLPYRVSKWGAIDLCRQPFPKGGLKAWCRNFGIMSAMPDMHGGKVQDLWEKGERETILAYNKEDVRLTGELYLAASTVWEL
jgi:predicted PolB exonuclease-like 3'-5' exonuclease